MRLREHFFVTFAFRRLSNRQDNFENIMKFNSVALASLLLGSLNCGACKSNPV